MAKTYAFRFKAQRAEFSAHFVTMTFGPGCTLAEETREMTFAEALEYLPRFSAAAPGPHVADLQMANRNDRKPAGFDKATARGVHKTTA
ncbi:hypothetical protein [Azohydromonas aeria]|uniref:hypothetical protein n=1 Tax=Azohydromonas aeria TaxID=2590212 RepID=UPI0012F916F1|nr:hypothetical protein [Azohydromonas aeria]